MFFNSSPSQKTFEAAKAVLSHSIDAEIGPEDKVTYLKSLRLDFMIPNFIFFYLIALLSTYLCLKTNLKN